LHPLQVTLIGFTKKPLALGLLLTAITTILSVKERDQFATK
jgi:hypothetical protein